MLRINVIRIELSVNNEEHIEISNNVFNIIVFISKEYRKSRYIVTRIKDISIICCNSFKEIYKVYAYELKRVDYNYKT